MICDTKIQQQLNLEGSVDFPAEKASHQQNKNHPVKTGSSVAAPRKKLMPQDYGTIKGALIRLQSYTTFNPSNGCLEWNRPLPTFKKKNNRPYPNIRVLGVKMLVSHFVYEQKYGSIPEGMVIRHTCDNHKCVNIEHLIIGTQKQNMQDCVQRNRTPIGMKHPKSKMTDDLVRQLRAEYGWFKPGCTQKALSKKFGIATGLVSDILNGKRWGHVK